MDERLLPNLKCVALSMGGASHIKTVQRVGRALRGCGEATVLDVVDVVRVVPNKYLEHAEERLKALRRAFGQVPIIEKTVEI